MKNLNKVNKHFLREIILMVTVLLLPLGLSAQIKLGEDKSPKEKDPEWFKVKNKIFEPYDGSYLHMKVYPTLDAYKKYIGQQLYLPPLTTDAKNGYFRLFSDQGIEIINQSKERQWHYVWHPALSVSDNQYEYRNDESFICNKYYNIIDVLSIESEEYIKHHTEPYRSKGFYGNNEELILNEFGYKGTAPYDKDVFFYANMAKDRPYFVLKETRSGDIVYTTQSDEFILVSGFEKIRKKLEPLIGENIYRLRATINLPTSRNIDNYLNGDNIVERWTCTDIVLRVINNPEGRWQYPDERYHQIKLVLKDIKDPTEEKEIDYRELINRTDTYVYEKNYINESLYNEMINKVLEKFTEEERAKKGQESQLVRKDVASEKEKARKEAQYKRELINKYGTETAQKILNKELEIGMSKAVCKEILKGKVIYVANKTATSEIWKIIFYDIWTNTDNVSYLHFKGDKLVEIYNR